MPPFTIVTIDEFFGEIDVAKADALSEIKDEWAKQQVWKKGLYDRMELRLNGEALEVATWDKEKKAWKIEIA